MNNLKFLFYRIFGKKIISVDYSKDGDYQCIGYVLNGKLYIHEFKELK